MSTRRAGELPALVIGTLSVAPGGTTTINLTGEFVEEDPLGEYEILLEADTDGDGFLEQLGSMGFDNFIAPTSCCTGVTGNADGSGDDVVDISDVFAVVDYLGASIPLSACDTENDANIDGVVDISDLFTLIDYLSGAAGLPNCP